jgi:hypothetical protein
MSRLRLGIALFVISWLPIAQVVLVVAHEHQKLTSGHASSVFRLGVWTVQFFIGLVGIWLAGKIVIQEAKREGLRQTPQRLWQLFWHGQEA